ncbi:MAG: peptidylprolyl isomerase [Beijerinckiaceae bacterium]|jgi:peptidylprolyl isomerase|nr:peptidylprolyl isomerase [Beijerinckiaceae bacterium]
MTIDRRKVLIGLPAAAALAVGAAHAQPAPSKKDLLYIELKNGRVVVQLRPDLAPKHVAQIKTLAKRGFYDGIVFHRVIEGFMAQTGDPTGTGRGGSDLPNIPAEFTPTPFERGTLGMARSDSPNSANSQFFICFKEADFLNNKYTVVGKVVSGMEFVDKITRGEPPRTPDKMIKVTVSD